MPEEPPVDSDGEIIGDVPWKFFEPSRDTFTCPDCGMTSHHPDDVAWSYCGKCHEFKGLPRFVSDTPTAAEPPDPAPDGQ